MNLKRSFILATIFGLILIVGWELYWRSQNRTPNLDDNKALWAQQWSKFETSNENKIVFIGSSRILFDIQRPIWKKYTNTDAIMLGVQGGTPLPILKQVLEDTNYKGLIVVGVAPDLFFWASEIDDFSWKRSKALLDYSKDRTYAQRINQNLSIPLQKNLAFYRDGNEEWSDDVDLATLLKNLRSGERAGPIPPPFFNFEDVHLDRNVEMSTKATQDSVFANTIIKAWGLDEWEKEIEDSEEYKKMQKDIENKRNKVISYFSKYAEEYTRKGGSIVLVRCPSSGKYRDLERRDFPREEFWDSLVNNTNLPSIHFEDYPQLMGLKIPELSHLSKEDANFFTLELIKIFKQEGILSNNTLQ
ncbi:MAG TPA: hypothetical protein DCS66_24810 [Flavobacteriaceae bacterium]|nr:hypothetical protein [Flavobacteriaceae bacterium]HAT67781.1 hypothetical protein [Flavobacteriaceae bacterium]